MFSAHRPFILRFSINATSLPWLDENASNESLPAQVETVAFDTTCVRSTRLTKIRTETTDDE